MKTRNIYVGIAFSLSLLLGGCAAMNVAPRAVRGGDSILVPAGRSKSLSRQNMTVTITPATGSSIKYGPNDPNVRAVVNLYPDPVSRLLVGSETGQSLGSNAADYGAAISRQVADQDKDWWQTLVYLDLPQNLSLGIASINISGPDGSATSEGLLVEIIPGVGSPGNLVEGSLITAQQTESMIRSLERAEHRTVAFGGPTVPHSIQIELSHTPGQGKAWVVNPRGDVKNVVWSDTGSTLRVLLTPTHGETLEHLAHFKFYVAGGLTNLQITALKAYDVNGNPVTNIVADIQ